MKRIGPDFGAVGLLGLMVFVLAGRLSVLLGRLVA